MNMPPKRTSKKRAGTKTRTGSKKRAGPKKRATPKRRTKASFVNAMRKLSRLRAPQRVQAVKLANNAFVREFCQNVKALRHARLSPQAQKRLRQSSTKLRKLVSGKTSIPAKRDMLTQRGGFLGLLAPLILKAIVNKVL